MNEWVNWIWSGQSISSIHLLFKLISIICFTLKWRHNNKWTRIENWVNECEGVWQRATENGWEITETKNAKFHWKLMSSVLPIPAICSTTHSMCVCGLFYQQNRWIISFSSLQIVLCELFSSGLIVCVSVCVCLYCIGVCVDVYVDRMPMHSGVNLIFSTTRLVMQYLLLRKLRFSYKISTGYI